mmetsp:Transcript_25162/g.40856  ORF Transcript_25162/g.40856 Transcript_25162/m.40856 type:complete len:524 (+) Transcript_25162:185-1756(+)
MASVRYNYSPNQTLRPTYPIFHRPVINSARYDCRHGPGSQNSFLLGSGLATLLLLNSLDDTHSHSLPHVTHGETAKRRVFRKGLHTHRLGRLKGGNAGITVLDKLRVLLQGLTRAAIHLLGDISKFAGNVGSMAIQHRGVTLLDLTRVVHDDDLGSEVGAAHGRVVLGVRSNITTLDVLDRHILHVETDIITGHSLRERLVVHLHRLYLSANAVGGELHHHTRLDHTGLDTAHRHGADTTNLVHILQRQTERLVGGSLGGVHVVKSLEKGGALVPSHVGGLLNHVVAVPARDRDEGNLGGLVADLLEVSRHLSHDLIVTALAVHDGRVVHLVHAHNHLLHTKGEGKQTVLAGLALLGDTSLELTDTRGDDEQSHIGLGGTSNHVLDEISVTRSINDGVVELGGLELPQSDIDGDTTLTLGLEVVKHPGILERGLAELSSLLLELLNGTLINTTAFVDQMTSGGGLAGIDVTDDHKVHVNLFLSHCEIDLCKLYFSGSEWTDYVSWCRIWFLEEEEGRIIAIIS